MQHYFSHSEPTNVNSPFYAPLDNPGSSIYAPVRDAVTVQAAPKGIVWVWLYDDKPILRMSENHD